MQEFTAPLNTNYKIECWGASGGNHAKSGRGGYTEGLIDVVKANNLYIYVGGIGKAGTENNDIRDGGWNGGGNLHSSLLCDCGSGGGATDIRLTNESWDDFNSLKSRIMVAAGGGGQVIWHQGCYGGHAGGLVAPITYSRNYSEIYISGSTQTSGAKALKSRNGSWPKGEDGSFGKGGKGGSAFAGGGGGGYYGGAGGTNQPVVDGFKPDGDPSGGEIGGTGGSSFISGYTGCDAISESSTEDNIIHTGQPNHYSGKVFTNSVMIAGNAIMPKPGGGTETGHSGDGYCIISWISPSL